MQTLTILPCTQITTKALIHHLYYWCLATQLEFRFAIFMSNFLLDTSIRRSDSLKIIRECLYCIKIKYTSVDYRCK